jgi:hypothetical protein
MRSSIRGAVVLPFVLLGTACSPPIVTSNVTVVTPAEVVEARRPVPPPIAAPPSAPSSTCTQAATATSDKPAAPSITIKGSALQGLVDADLAKRALDTSKGLRGLASIGRRDEDAVRNGVQLTYAKTPDGVRSYILWQYSFSRMKVLDEERELTRRLGDQVEGSDAVFEAPRDEQAIENAADALEALARRLVADP